MQVLSQSRLSSQRQLAEPEALRSRPLPLQRPAESVAGAAAIVCRAGVLPPSCSQDPSEGLGAPRRDAICPRYSQHAGDADNERHVEFGTVMGAVCNQRGGLGADPIRCRRS